MPSLLKHHAFALEIRRFAIAALIAYSITVAANAQAARDKNQPPPPAKADTAPTTQPTFVYSEPSFGFEITLPAIWSYDRTRFTAPGGSMGLMRGRSVAERATLQVCFSPGFDKLNFKSWITKFENQLMVGAPLKRVDRSERETDGRAGFILEFDEETPTELRKSFYYCVLFDPSTVWILIYAGALPTGSDSAAVREQFRSMIATLRITATPIEQGIFSDALMSGEKLMIELPERGPQLPLDGDTRYYDMTLAGKSIGYFTRRVSRESMSLDDPRFGGNRKDGIRVHERTWRFDEDGSGRSIRVDLFASFDLQSEIIESEESSLPPKVGAAPLVVTTTDRVIREGETLFSSVVSNLDAKLPERREPIRVGSAYLGLAWTRVLPALVGARSQEPRAFSVYDSTTRGLLTHLIQPIGPASIPESDIGGGYLVETREAFSTSPSRIYCEASGAAARIESGELLLRLSTAKEIEKKYGALRKEAEERIRRYSKPYDPRKPLGR
ncbi:MAG: hypothetical protein JNG88_16090 [Phycisphaerales bacterium]|nr:hypothetical protein [Phycisphaerales bacterium]